ncbi:ramp2 [Pungitius sinensis]
MIRYLLVPVLLLLADVESQTNMTKEEWSHVERNQTSSESTPKTSSMTPRTMTPRTMTPRTMTPGNMTSSWYENETSLIEGKLQSNQTSGFVSEEDEKFQKQENSIRGRCNENVLIELSHSYCGADFHTEMSFISPMKWCEMEYIIRPYNALSTCLELLSHLVGCYSPNPITQDFFLSIHSHYFHNCSKEDLQFEDPPHGLVVALTLVPVSIIPVLVYLVVCKSGV